MVVPLIEQMNPNASAVAGGGPLELDLGNVELGRQVIVRWQAPPIFVVFRTPEMLEALRNTNTKSRRS